MSYLSLSAKPCYLPWVGDFQVVAQNRRKTNYLMKVNLILCWSLSKNRFRASGSQPGVVWAPWRHFTSSGDKQVLIVMTQEEKGLKAVMVNTHCDVWDGLAQRKLTRPHVHSANVHQPHFT